MAANMLDSMLYRNAYSTEEMRTIFDDRTIIQNFLDIEKALAQVQGEMGIIPKEAADEICKKGFVENLDIGEIEAGIVKVGHSLVPILRNFQKKCDNGYGEYIHLGATTQDILDTGFMMSVKRGFEAVYRDALEAEEAVLDLVDRYADTVMAGRTHGKHAIPITYGYKVSVYISELLNSLERLEECEKRVFVAMMGGAVGGFNATGRPGRRIQERVAETLGMRPMDVPSRNMSQMKVEYLMNLSLLCNTLHKMAEEVYYTGIEEFSEVSESFTPGTIGSSTMPQKINPKLAKGIIANSQKLYSLSTTGLYSAVRMFEGDSSSYMLFDGLMEEGLELATEVLIRGEELTRTLHVNRERMLQNVNLNRGLDNSEYVMMNVAAKLGKDKAHELMYDKAMKVELEGRDYLSVLLEDDGITAMFSEEELRSMIDPASYTGLCSEIAADMAGKAKAAAGELRARIE